MTQSLVVTQGIHLSQREIESLGRQLCRENGSRKAGHSSGKWFITLEGGQATQDNYKDGVRLCREKIKGVKAQLELNLVKDNKCFYKCICSKSSAKENPTFYCMQWGHIMKKVEEKAVQMPSLPHSLTIRLVVLLVPSP